MKVKAKTDTARQQASKQLGEEIWRAINEVGIDIIRSSLDGTQVRTRKFAHIDHRFEVYIEIRSRIA